MRFLPCNNWELLNLNGTPPQGSWSCSYRGESLQSQREPRCQSPGARLSPMGHQQLPPICPPSRSAWGSAERSRTRGHGASAELLSKGRGMSALGSQPWHHGWEMGMGPNTQSLSVIKKKKVQKFPSTFSWRIHMTEKSISLISIAIFTGPLFVQKLGRPPPISRFLLVICRLTSLRAAAAIHLSGPKI